MKRNDIMKQRIENKINNDNLRRNTWLFIIGFCSLFWVVVYCMVSYVLSITNM